MAYLVKYLEDSCIVSNRFMLMEANFDISILCGNIFYIDLPPEGVIHNIRVTGALQPRLGETGVNIVGDAVELHIDDIIGEAHRID